MYKKLILHICALATAALLCGCASYQLKEKPSLYGNTAETSETESVISTEYVSGGSIAEQTETACGESGDKTCSDSNCETETEPVPGTESEIITETESEAITETESEAITETEREETAAEEDPGNGAETGESVYCGLTEKGFEIYRKDGITYIDGIMIVNKSYPLPENYAPGRLTDEFNTAFSKMQADAKTEGISLFVCSGYRSYATQAWVYGNYCARDGRELADTYSARAGHSEHQSGLAADINSIYLSFEKSAEGIWLAEHCTEYGFIIRYPKEKNESTGYMYEPWHIRYVGTELAATLRENGETLEEYFGIDSVYRTNP